MTPIFRGIFFEDTPEDRELWKQLEDLRQAAETSFNRFVKNCIREYIKAHYPKPRQPEERWVPEEPPLEYPLSAESQSHR